ncbi:DUF2062 domain-containing protein [Desulfobacterales bacterium HSG2]|nr:DUF2062 domain-containing protein [Desulfobacterales bacterium HSG2]
MLKEVKKQQTGNGIKDKLSRTLKKAYERLIRIRGHPREIALGFALGIFVGMSPTLGFQMAIAVCFAALLKWNKVSAALGVWISNPVTAPVIYSVTYLIGAKLLGISKVDDVSGNLDSTTIYEWVSNAPEIVWALTVGGVIAGLPLAVFAYYFSYSAVRKYQEDIKRKLAQQKEKLIRKKEKLAKKRKEKKQKKKKKKRK